MILTADYHTHTKYSHGKGTVFENVKAAEEKNLSFLGISDHGFAHPAFGLTEKKVKNCRVDIDEANKKSKVKTLLGIESNILTEEGRTDLKPKMYPYFDIYLAGIHKFVLYGFKDIFKLFLPTYFTDILKLNPSSSLKKRVTKTYINVIKNNPVDIITHLNFCTFADPLEVAKCAADYGTYLEISAKKMHLSLDDINKIANTGVRFVIGSDAHSPERVGEISLAEKVIKESGIDTRLIDNIDGRLPKFRFGEYKEKHC